MSLLVQLLQKPERLSSGERAMNDYIAKMREAKDIRDSKNDLLGYLKKQKKKDMRDK